MDAWRRRLGRGPFPTTRNVDDASKQLWAQTPKAQHGWAWLAPCFPVRQMRRKELLHQRLETTRAWRVTRTSAARLPLPKFVEQKGQSWRDSEDELCEPGGSWSRHLRPQPSHVERGERRPRQI